MNLLKSFKMVSLLTAVLFLFGTLCLADGKANCDQMSAYIKHFTRHLHDIDFPIPELLKKICNTVTTSTTTSTEAVITSTSDSQGQTDNSTTTVKTTTDVVDYGEFNRMAVP